MKWLQRSLALVLVLLPIAARAQTAAISAPCTMGAAQANTSGLRSTNYQLGIIPSCRVEVFLTGTTNHPPAIYADGNNTPLANPFTASPAGFWVFFAPINTGYDVVLSGGIPPNTFPTPITLVQQYPAQQVISGSSGNISPGTGLQVGIYAPGSPKQINPSNITTDVNGNNLSVPGQVTIGGVPVGTTPLCPNGPGGQLTPTGCNLASTQVAWPPSCSAGVYSPAVNGCVPPGTAANPAGLSGETQINLGGLFNSISGSAPYADPNTHVNNGIMYKGGIVSGASPVADIRAFGAVIDATNTPIDNAILSAIGVCNTPSAYNNSCQVLLPCVGQNTSSGCTILNGSLLPPNTTGKTIELDFQGVLSPKSTLVIPNYYTLVGKGGGGAGQFQSVGAVSRILGPAMKGGIGTPIPGYQTGSITAGTGTLTLSSVTNHTVGETIQAASAGFAAVDYRGTVTNITGNVLTVTPNSALNLAGALWTVVSKFTPTFTTGTSDNFHVNSAIGVGGYQTCTAVSATRDGTIAANQPNTAFVAGSSINQISIASNVLTVLTPNSFTVGQTVGLIGFKQANLLFLNEQFVTIITATATQFTAALTHADLVLTADVSGNPTATTCTSSSGLPENIRIAVAQTITVTGCVDSSFNVNQANVNGQDWPQSTIQIYEGGSVGITGISIASNVLTVRANNTFTAGRQVTFFNVVNHPFLNGLTLTIATASPTQFTVALPGLLGRSDEITASDAGDATVTLVTSSTTGCTVTGIDDYSYEVVRIEGIDTVPITQIGIASNVLTVTAANTFSNGELLNFSQVKTNSYLNGQTVTILTASSSQFTAAFTHANVTLAADTGAVGRMNALASGSTLSATFAHTHAPADLWGMAAVSTSDQQGGPKAKFDLQSVLISNAYGPQLWMDNVATINLTGVAMLPVQYPTSSALECDGCWWGQLNSVQALGNPVAIHCITNCGTPSYSYSFHFSQDSTRRNFIGGANMIVRDMTVVGGIKIDGNYMDNSAGSGPQLAASNLTVERQAYAGIVADNSKGLANVAITTDFMLLSDNYAQVYLQDLAATDCCLNNGFANLGTQNAFVATALKNKYWMNGVQTAGGPGGAFFTQNMAAIAPSTTTGFLSDGEMVNANIRGSGANLSPALIPAATLPVLNPTCGTCIPVTGPDGVANSALEVQTSAGPTSVQLQVAAQPLTTYAGDMIAFGSWVAPGALQAGKTPGSAFGRNAYLNLFTFGADLFQGGISTTYSPTVSTNSMFAGGLFPVVDDSWQPAIQIVTFIKGDPVAHSVRINAISGSTAQGVGSGNRFWDWWWMFIPGPNNPAYTGVTRQEVMRWIQDMLHSYIPPSAPAGGGILATCPSCKYNNLSVISSRKGTFTCTAGGTITVPNVNAIAGSDITFSLNTVGGTITAAPAMKTAGNGVNFQVLCGATDTSVYNYAIWN